MVENVTFNFRKSQNSVLGVGFASSKESKINHASPQPKRFLPSKVRTMPVADSHCNTANFPGLI